MSILANWRHLASRPARLVRRDLRLGSGLVLFGYITTHLANHALGLISLEAAERGLRLTASVWLSWPGTFVLYGAAAVHFLMALWAVCERRTFRLPPAELLRIALGFALPLLLIGHVAATRIAYELYALSPDYTRVVANLWVSDSQGRQLGLLAPGWLHGCMGLHIAFRHRPGYQRARHVLFAVALLLPVLSALGFVAMGRQLVDSPVAAAAAFNYLSPTHATQRIAIAQWRDGLLAGYFAIIALAFGGRAIRSMIEHGGKSIVSITYPGRIVRVPRGWSVLEASRSFHIPHASTCGGRARCSTCRVRITAGEDACPPPQADERRILERISAPSDIRLACQLRPRGDVSVVPLVRTERPVYRQELASETAEQDVVLLVCDLFRRPEAGGHCLPHDFLYVATRYVETICLAIRNAGGATSAIGTDGVQALFGLQSGSRRGADQALAAARSIEKVASELDERIGRRSRMRIMVSLHSGRAVVGDVGEPSTILAAGDAVDAMTEIRKALSKREGMFAISQPVYEALGIVPTDSEEILVQIPDHREALVVHLSASPPSPPQRRSPSRLRSRLGGLWRRAGKRPPGQGLRLTR